MPFRLLITLVIALGLSGVVANAQKLKNENILIPAAPGYVQGFSAKQGHQQITEWVPKGQSVQKWREMLTLNIFVGGVKGGIAGFENHLVSGFNKACKNSEHVTIRTGKERGYPFILFMVVCPHNLGTGKPEWVWVKAIEGRDSVYVMQKAWKYKPRDKDVVKWTQYLRKIVLCDSRSNTAPCS